ncbi:MAG: insulinase family protein [Holosporales bacterium]|nr:insulinase family protein [Holosporales bacterium]
MVKKETRSKGVPERDAGDKKRAQQDNPSPDSIASSSAPVKKSTAARNFRPVPSKSNIPDFKLDIREIKTKLPNTIWYIPSDLPIVLISIGFKNAGFKNVLPIHPSLPCFISSMLDKGAGKYNQLEYTKRLYDNGASLSFSVGPDNAAGTLWAPADSYKKPLELAILALTNPRLPENELKKAKECALIDIEESLKVPKVLLRDAMNKLYYPKGHPYRHSIDETKTDIPLVKTNDIRKYLKFLSQSNACVIILGPREKQGEIVAEVVQQLQKLPQEGAPTVSGAFQRNQDLTDTHVAFDVPQSIIIARTDGFTKADPEYFPKKMAFWVLAQSSMTSMVFQHIRETHGLAYYCGGQLIKTDMDNYIQFIIGTKNESAGDAKRELCALFTKVGQDGMTKGQFETGMQEMLGGLVVGLDSSGSQVGFAQDLRMDGYSAEEVKRFSFNIAGVTYEQSNRALKELCKTFVKKGQLVFGSVGKTVKAHA